jgi:hypothetical protein
LTLDGRHWRSAQGSAHERGWLVFLTLTRWPGVSVNSEGSYADCLGHASYACIQTYPIWQVAGDTIVIFWASWIPKNFHFFRGGTSRKKWNFQKCTFLWNFCGSILPLICPAPSIRASLPELAFPNAPPCSPHKRASVFVASARIYVGYNRVVLECYPSKRDDEKSIREDQQNQ